MGQLTRYSLNGSSAELSAPYAMSVPDIAYHAYRQTAPYALSGPDIAYNACRQTAPHGIAVPGIA
eukprot:3584134-Rhodomonas_salina.2